MDNLPAPEPTCPQCGQKQWQYDTIPGQVATRERLSAIANKARLLGGVLVLVGLLLLLQSYTQAVSFVCGGMVLVLIPISFLFDQLASTTATRIDTCKACGHTTAS